MIRLALLISGSGTTAEAVLFACRTERLRNIKPVLMISSNTRAGGLLKAKAFDVATEVVSPKQYRTREDFGKAMLVLFRKYRVDIVSQNGWLPLTPPNVIEVFAGRIINQHPGPLDPGRSDFGGKGMYGRRVTCARIAYAWVTGDSSWTEATTHHVTADFDRGKVIRTEKLVFSPGPAGISFEHLRRDPKQLMAATTLIAQTLLPLEHKNVTATLGEYAKTGKFSDFRRKKRLVEKRHQQILDTSKKLAMELFPKG